jgi:glutamate/tyrosine decarboxylase-like PLP-dependent enzyme
LFRTASETGLDDLREIAHRALTTFADKNILDFLEFSGAIKLERHIVDVARKN